MMRQHKAQRFFDLVCGMLCQVFGHRWLLLNHFPAGGTTIIGVYQCGDCHRYDVREFPDGRKCG